MTKFAIATHGHFAKGLQTTLDLFVPNEEVAFLSAYVPGEPPIEEQLNEFLHSITPEEEAVIFTDLFGGSVNQKVLVEAQGKTNIHIIAGFNLPVVLEVILNKEELDEAKLHGLVESGKQAMQVVTTEIDCEQTEAEFFE